MNALERQLGESFSRVSVELLQKNRTDRRISSNVPWI